MFLRLPNHCLTVNPDNPDRFDCCRCRRINISQKLTFLQRECTESGLQARPLFFNNLQTVLPKLCHNCDTRIFALFSLFTKILAIDTSFASGCTRAQRSPGKSC
jgi:hypothetical protein